MGYFYLTVQLHFTIGGFEKNDK